MSNVKLTVYLPALRARERRYAVHTVMRRLLEDPVELVEGAAEAYRVSSEDGRELVIADVFFPLADRRWLLQESLPSTPLPLWDTRSSGIHPQLVHPALPILYGNKPSYQREGGQPRLGLDVFGAAFFMLTRYEELVSPLRDRYDRFAASSSLAYRENFLLRPLVDEYCEVLWACLESVWPELTRKSESFRVVPSHDVDEPLRFLLPELGSLFRQLGRDVLRHRSLSRAVASCFSWMRVRSGDFKADPCFNFSQIMTLSEELGLRSAFFFIADHTAGRLDGIYNLDHPAIAGLLREINSRGHEIGLHPSFETYLDAAQTNREADRLRRACQSLSIHQEKWGGRQHFLRWRNPTTFQNYQDALLDYDTTLGFADHVGFRCGTCHPYPVYDLEKSQVLRLVERPLVVMDNSLLERHYMNLGRDTAAAYAVLCQLKKACRTVGGEFTLLWHNSRFTEPGMWELYEQILRAAV